MNAETPDAPGGDVFDDWQWHVEGAFPPDQPPEQAYVHIGVFVAWLARNDLIAADLRTGEARRPVEQLADGSGTFMALLGPTSGRLTAAMLGPEGRAFAGSYYAPEYGYARDWRRVFGRRADTYAVPGTWDTYARMEPILDRRHAEWTASGRPELMPLPGLMGRLARLLDRRH
jgi:hypothetical protein